MRRGAACRVEQIFSVEQFFCAAHICLLCLTITNTAVKSNKSVTAGWSGCSYAFLPLQYVKPPPLLPVSVPLYLVTIIGRRIAGLLLGDHHRPHHLVLLLLLLQSSIDHHIAGLLRHARYARHARHAGYAAHTGDPHSLSAHRRLQGASLKQEGRLEQERLLGEQQEETTLAAVGGWRSGWTGRRPGLTSG